MYEHGRVRGQRRVFICRGETSQEMQLELKG